MDETTRTTGAAADGASLQRDYPYSHQLLRLVLLDVVDVLGSVLDPAADDPAVSDAHAARRALPPHEDSERVYERCAELRVYERVSAFRFNLYAVGQRPLAPPTEQRSVARQQEGESHLTIDLLYGSPGLSPEGRVRSLNFIANLIAQTAENAMTIR